jgi:hypothetical protein
VTILFNRLTRRLARLCEAPTATFVGLTEDSGHGTYLAHVNTFTGTVFKAMFGSEVNDTVDKSASQKASE